MKLMRTISLLLAISLLSSCFLSVGALEMTDSDLVVVHDEEKNNRIDALFALRSKLELDYEANEEQINQIDSQLEQLGVESISYGVLLNKLGVDALPDVSVTSTSTTSWTSRRTVVTYRGQQYELQTIEGIPIDDTDSPLERTSITINYEAAGVVAGITEAVKVVGATAMGEIPVIGSVLTVASTLYDLLVVRWNSMSTSTVIEDIAGSATVTMTAHQKYIFVKGYGSSDQYQILCYIGNYVSYYYTTVIPYDIPGDGTSEDVHIIYTSEHDTVYSKYYNDYTRATNNYYNARNNIGNEMIFNYKVSYLKLSIFNSEERFSVPFEDADITY